MNIFNIKLLHSTSTLRSPELLLLESKKIETVFLYKFMKWTLEHRDYIISAGSAVFFLEEIFFVFLWGFSLGYMYSFGDAVYCTGKTRNLEDIFVSMLPYPQITKSPTGSDERNTSRTGILFLFLVENPCNLATCNLFQDKKQNRSHNFSNQSNKKRTPKKKKRQHLVQYCIIFKTDNLNFLKNKRSQKR